MELCDVTAIIFSSVAANHLGLVAAAERAVRHELPIVNCPKCLSFWIVLIYGIYHCGGIATWATFSAFGLAFLSAWAAIWLELIMGFIDQLYYSIYDKIYPTANSTDANALSTTGDLSGMPEETGFAKITEQSE